MQPKMMNLLKIVLFMTFSTATLTALDKQKFNVVFLGGSITQGARASANSNTWAYKVGEYLKKHFSDKDVKVNNSGVGGTGSMLGIFRLQKDVVAFQPDLVFVEYAVNDIGENPTTVVSVLKASCVSSNSWKNHPSLFLSTPRLPPKALLD